MERKDVMAKNVSMYKSQASALEQHAAPNCKGGEQEMEVDTITSDVQPSGKSTLLELEIFCYLIVLFLFDQKMHNEVCSVPNTTFVLFIVTGDLADRNPWVGSELLFALISCIDIRLTLMYIGNQEICFIKLLILLCFCFSALI